MARALLPGELWEIILKTGVRCSGMPFKPIAKRPWVLVDLSISLYEALDLTTYSVRKFWRDTRSRQHKGRV